MGFLESHGRAFPQHHVEFVHAPGTPGESRVSSRGIIQGNSGQFNVDTPIYEGDLVELPDPRGGTRSLYVAHVKVNDVGGGPGAFAGMSHINVKWGSPPQKAEPSQRTVVNIKGGVNQLAWGNHDVTQSQVQGQEWPADLEGILQQIVAALDVLEAPADDRAMLLEDAQTALDSIKSGESPAARKRALATVKGILGDLASGVGQGVGAGAVVWAQAALNAVLGAS
jgi:hypothetical protein